MEQLDLGLCCTCTYLLSLWLTYECHSLGKGFPNVEDLENWHGKPLGVQAEAAIAACKKAIKNLGPHGIKPLAIIDDAPHFTVPTVKLDTPPNYKLGEKVGKTEKKFEKLEGRWE